MTHKEIMKNIYLADLNLTELNMLHKLIQDKKIEQAKRSIKVGDNVWVVQKTKRTPGAVEDIKIKKAIVNLNGISYRVPLSMIEAA
mgnify:CR=1 FL=1